MLRRDRGVLGVGGGSIAVATVDEEGVFLIGGGAPGVVELRLEAVLLHLEVEREVVPAGALEHAPAHLHHAQLALQLGDLLLRVRDAPLLAAEHLLKQGRVVGLARRCRGWAAGGERGGGRTREQRALGRRGYLGWIGQRIPL